ncbi:MAG: hypothetical protein RL148_2290 [Planctomycetota bacterium]|jgi:hypothetical protein
MSDSIEAIRRQVEAEGCHVELVADDSGEVVCAHTVGLARDGRHPELVVFGLDAEQSLALFDAVMEELDAGRKFEPGREYQGIVQRYPVAVREVAPANRAVFEAAVAFHGNATFPMLQVFWPDKQGRFPWDPGVHDAVRADQPSLEVAR